MPGALDFQLLRLAARGCGLAGIGAGPEPRGAPMSRKVPVGPREIAKLSYYPTVTKTAITEVNNVVE
jgi:hypothetical protein